MEKSYLINAYQTPVSKILRFLLGWLWLAGAILGFMIIETSLTAAPHKVISSAHFIMAFLGAMLGLGISKAAKEWVMYVSSDVSVLNE